MWYVEYLRCRSALIAYTVGLFASGLFLVSLRYSNGAHVQIGEGDIPHLHGFELGVVAGACTAFVATSLALCLQRQNNGHLEIAWTKPLSRTQLAFSLIGVDMLAIVVGFIGTFFVFELGGLAAMGALKIVDTSCASILGGLSLVVFPLSWYGLILALTASTRARGGIIAGLAWPLGFTFVILAAIRLPEPYHRTFVILNYANPMAYISTNDDRGAVADLLGMAHGATPELLGMAVIAAVGVLLAIAQWERLEA